MSHATSTLDAGELRPGDVLSYAAGSTQTGPAGFRVQRARPSLFEPAFARWPQLRGRFGGGGTLFINAYPALIDRFGNGVSIDTYLSPRVLSRALLLGHRDRRPTVLAGQPLFLADALLRHLDREGALPPALLLALGGYTLPASLERTLRGLIAERVEQLEFLHFYGAAEVDAGCLVARERTPAGAPIYYPRPDVEPELESGELLLSLRGPGDELLVQRFPTGSRAHRVDEGWCLSTPARLAPEVEALLESWGPEAWRRRTGYLRREGGRVWLQLRAGEAPRHADELEHYAFARSHGFSWLDKPVWS